MASRYKYKRRQLQMTNVVPMHASNDEFPVAFVRDTLLTSPELWLDIYVAPDSDAEGALIAEMFSRARCSRADDPLEADLVIFGGGSDVNPALYGEAPHSKTDFNTERDARDIDLWQICIENRIPMFGICRGAQFLHVMNGGKLYQHLDGHVGNHGMWDSFGKQHLSKISSVHHQAVIRNAEMLVIGESGAATCRWKNPEQKVEGRQMDVEAFYYELTGSIGVQGHPEYRGYPEFTKWTLDLIQHLINENPDYELIKNLRRLKSA